jgi:hypothetical protein
VTGDRRFSLHGGDAAECAPQPSRRQPDHRLVK